jgi:hypothetical protein
MLGCIPSDGLRRVLNSKNKGKKKADKAFPGAIIFRWEFRRTDKSQNPRAKKSECQSKDQ